MKQSSGGDSKEVRKKGFNDKRINIALSKTVISFLLKWLFLSLELMKCFNTYK